MSKIMKLRKTTGEFRKFMANSENKRELFRRVRGYIRKHKEESIRLKTIPSDIRLPLILSAVTICISMGTLLINDLLIDFLRLRLGILLIVSSFVSFGFYIPLARQLLNRQLSSSTSRTVFTFDRKRRPTR